MYRECYPLPAQKPAIQVFERFFRIVNTLAGSSEPISLKSIAEQTKLHPSTAHRILSDLMLGGYVERPASGSYQLGMRFMELGNLVKSRLDVRQIALPFMQELQLEIGQPISLSLRQGDEIVYIERAYSERSGMQVVRAIGGRAPLHLTSVGKLFLAADSIETVQKYAHRTGLKGATLNSITRLEDLLTELKQVRESGLAHDNEELERGVRCIAMGLYDDENHLLAGLSVSAPAPQLNSDWIAKLQRCTDAINTLLGKKLG